MDKDEALKMAIAFMETLTIDVGIKTWNEKHRKEAVNACYKALEQPAQYSSLNEFIAEMEKDAKFKELMQQERAKLLAYFQVLEQPAQEPYAYEITHLSGTSPPPYFVRHNPVYKTNASTKVTPLYTHPAQPLSVWISVKDDMPAEYKFAGGGSMYSELVLCFGNYGIEVGRTINGVWANTMVNSTDVTHWMPLPDAPQAHGIGVDNNK